MAKTNHNDTVFFRFDSFVNVPARRKVRKEVGHCERRSSGCTWLIGGLKQQQIVSLFYFSVPRGNTMDSPRLAYPLSTEEQVDFDFPVLSVSSDIDNWDETQSLRTCSDDSRGLPSPVEGCSSSYSAVVQSRSSYDADPAVALASDKGSTSCPSSPTLLSCPPSWLELRPQLENEAGEIYQVPLSSSPPEFTSSSPTSDISSELGKEGSSSLTSASSRSLSDTASISSPQHFYCELRPDQFSHRLHELLLLVLRDRKLLRSTEETDCTTCTSRSDDSGQGSGSDNQAPKQTRYSYFAHIFTKALLLD